MNFVERILNLINQKGITKNKMLNDLQLNHNTFVNWTKNNQMPSVENVAKISDYFNVSTDYILCKTDEPTPPNKKDPPENENREGQVLYDALVEIGAIKDGDEITDKQATALLEYFINNKDYIGFLLDKNK